MIHLHVHSHYSLQDGIIKIPDLVAKAKELSMPAIAITEHGNISSWVEFQIECNKRKINPIFGIEAYCCEDIKGKLYHITLLAKNNKGIKEIVQLHNKSTLEQFYYKPRMTFDDILKCKNIIVMSGCLGSYLSTQLLNKEYGKAWEWVGRFENHFKSDFYIELQDLTLPKLDIVRERLKELNHIPKVITNDVHYLTKEDADAQYLFQCGQWHKKQGEIPRNPSEMWLKPDISVTIKNQIINTDTTYEIADKCSAKIHKYQSTLPNFTKHSFIKERLIDKERLREEYDTIKEAGYWPYLCIVSDYVKYAKSQGIAVGASRGSVGGSLLAYAMGIHDIDPIKYDLYFSRFYNRGRKDSMPDIDTDFSQSGIKQVKKYLDEKYSLAGMATYGKMGISACIKMLARVLDIPFWEANNISKKYKDYELNDIPIGELDDKWKDIIKLCHKFYGLFDKFGMHASGYILTHLDLHKEIPLRYSNDHELQSCWDMQHLEYLGFIKFDLLKIKTLDIIQEAMSLAKITEIDYDNEAAFDIISEGNNVGIFQISGSSGISLLAQQIKPQSIRDIADILAIYRPGPLQNKVDKEYVACRNNKPVKYLHPFLEPILKDTYGTMLFQEQIIQICIAIGFSEEDSDTIRKAMGKKKEHLLRKYKKQFIEKCGEISGENIAKDIWKQIAANSAYAFGLAHAVGYAYIAYTTAYLKANYPLEFYTACLNNSNLPADLQELITDMKPIKVLPPRLNKSSIEFKIEDDSIRYGIKGMYGIGEKDAERVWGLNDNVYYCESRNAGKTILLDTLTKGGYFDEIQPNRKTLVSNKGKRNQLCLIQSSDYTTEQKQEFEFNMLHIYLNDNPLAKYDMRGVFTGNNYIHGCRILAIVTNVQRKTNKKGRPYAVVEIININNHIDKFFVFSNKYSEININKGNYVLFLESFQDKWCITGAKKC